MKTFLSVFCCFILATFSGRAIIATNAQLQLGNPSGAITDPTNHNHYLIQRTVEAIDYCDNHGEPNWASWDVTSADIGSSGRSSSFYQDTNLPVSFHVITTGTFGGGYDRGHMCPSADRTDNTTDNNLVFFMSNIIPQASGNNQGPWADLENYTRTLLTTSECCIISGPYLFDGARTPNNSLVWVPQWTWKIIVVAPLGTGTVSNRVSASTRVICIKMPNATNITYGTWDTYITNAHQVEVDTGYKFFTALDTNAAEVFRWKIDGAAAPTITSFTPSSAAAGSTVTITGANFSKAAWVIFNNAYTTNFTVNSSSSITVTVPALASTGPIKVIAPGGLATSANSFTVGSSGSVLITSQPTSVTSNAGTTVNFAVQATGNGTLSYQWARNATPLSNGGAISGATTANLTVSGISQANVGSYTCVVTNSISSATSSVATLTVIDPPSITAQPSSASVNAGTAANFSVVATGTSPTYKWRKNGTALSDGGNISGSATASLTINSASSSDIASYSVVVSNAAGTVTSTDATLAVASVPVISAQPQNTTAAVGGSATFSVTASGGTLTYQWRKNGVAVSNGGDFAGSTTSALTVSPVAVSDAASYSVIVGNSVGATTSSSATLTLAGTVSIATQPSSQAVAAGGDATFTVSATGSGTLGYQWRFNGANIADATDSTYTRSSVSGADAGSYSVVVTNSFSSATSANAMLTIVTSQPSIIAQWNFNSPVPDGQVTNGTRNASIGTGTTAYTGGTTASSTGEFATGDTLADPAGTNDNSAWNTGTYPSQGTGNKSGGVLFGVSTVGYDNIVVTWSQRLSSTASRYCRFQYTTNGTDFIDSGVINMSADSTFLLKTNSLTGIADVNNNPNFAFRIVAEFESTAIGSSHAYYTNVSGGNGYSTGGTIRYDIMTISGTPLTSPGIVAQPQDQTNNAGSTATFNVVASGSSPLSYKWRRNGTPLSDGAKIAGSATSVLTVSNVGSSDAASYSVVVSNSVGSVTSADAALVVNVAPAITTQPTSRTNVAGTTATFTVAATGTDLQYQWRKNGNVLPDGGNVSGVTSSVLTLANVTTADAATYSVEVSNALSVISSSPATLTVISAPPSVAAQPLSQTTFAGADIVFNVSVTGTAPFTYQWRQDGENLIDAGNVVGSQTASLTVQNVHDADNGAYSVVVQNSAGSTTSADGQLTVVPFANRLLNISTNANGTPALLWSVVPGDSYSFEYKDALTDPQWTSLGVYLPGSSTLFVSDTATNPQRFYRLNSDEGVTDIAGYLDLSTLGNSDNYLSMPFARPSAGSLLVASVSGNVVNVTPAPGWTADQFVYASGTQSNTYYARFTSGAAEGRIYPITANDSASVTLNLGSDTLSDVAANDSISIEPYWTLGTVFPNGTAVNVSPTIGNRNTEVLTPDLASAGINLSATKVYFFNAGVWKEVGQGSANHNDDVLLPNSYVIVRHNVATNTTVFAAGVVVSAKLTAPIRAQTNLRQDNSIGLIRPAAFSLNASGLITSGAFQSSPLPGSRTDELLTFDNTIASRNKSASAVYYYWSNAWREVGFGSTDVGTNLLLAGTGFIIRKGTNSATAVWTSAPNW